MEKEPFFIYDPNYEEESRLYKKLIVMLDAEERAKAKFMKNFMLALMKPRK